MSRTRPTGPRYDEAVPDRLYLSYSLPAFEPSSMLKPFETMLRKFPFSKLVPGVVLRGYALEPVEPPLFETRFEDGTAIAGMVEAARDWIRADHAFEAYGAWDLWQWDGDWNVAPARVSLWCLGPDFDDWHGDHLRIEFGVDSLFLPAPGIKGSARFAESNLRSLLRLTQDLDLVLSPRSRRLWSESGENFAERLQAAVLDVQ